MPMILPKYDYFITIGINEKENNYKKKKLNDLPEQQWFINYIANLARKPVQRFQH